jgi:hypothetical protein
MRGTPKAKRHEIPREYLALPAWPTPPSAIRTRCRGEAAHVLLAPGKVMPGFRPNSRGQVNVLVTLRCTPERFHVLEFQSHGRVSGTQTIRSKSGAFPTPG